MPRRYGPTQGAGTVLVERDVQNGITPAPFGSTAYIGQVERGAVGEVSTCVSSADFIRKHGTYMEGSEVPNCAIDFFSLNGGAGSLSVVRVTDGNEVASSITVYSRHKGISESNDRLLRVDQRVPLFTLRAKNGGEWAGRTKVIAFAPASFTDTELTLADGDSIPVNALKGARVSVMDNGVVSSFSVVSNTETKIVLDPSSLFKTECDGAGVATPSCLAHVDAYVRPVNATGMVSGSRQALSVAFKDGEANASSTFGMEVYVDGGLVRSYTSLSLDPNSEFYIESIVSEDSENHFIEVADIYSGAITSRHRPASFAGTPVKWAGREITFSPVEVRPVLANMASTSKGRVIRPVFGAQAIPMKMAVTIDANGDGVVSVSDFYGASFLGSVDAGSLGYEASYAFDAKGVMTIEAPHDMLCGLVIHEGKDAFAEGDRFEVEFNPFPTEQSTSLGLLNGSLINPDGQRVSLSANSANALTLNSSFESPVEGRSYTEDNYEIMTFNVSPQASVAEVTVNSVLRLSVQSPLRGGVMVKDLDRQSVGGNPVALDTIDDLVDNLNLAVENDADLKEAFGADPFKVELTDSAVPASGGAVVMDLAHFKSSTVNADSLEAFISMGVEFGTVAGAILTQVSSASFTVDAEGFDEVATVNDPFMLYCPVELRGGSNGGAPTASDYIEAFNVETSPINRLRGKKLGLVKLACPAVTDTSVQKAGIAYAEARNYQFRVEIPYSVQSETGAVSYVNGTIGRNNYAVTSFPSRAHVINPLGGGVIQQSLTGMIHGREASIAGNFDGYHKASAGESATLPAVVRLPWSDRIMNEEVTNPVGLNLIKKLSGNFVLWGDRSLSLETGWKWKHQREYMSHIENTLLESFDSLIFGINDRQARNGLTTVFQMFFLPEFQKRALRGATFDEAVSIKIDEENNTDLSMANGELNAEISLRLAETIERFIISVSKAGVRTNLG